MTAEARDSVFIVDDDPAVRDALSVVLELEGFDTRGFDGAEPFIEALKIQQPSCVLLDVHMPGRSGLDVLKAIDVAHFPAPVFIISGQGDIPMAVNAIKLGAFDFIEKPFDADFVVGRIREALAAFRQEPSGVPAAVFPGSETLTPRERDVLAEITAGASNKEAGRRLGISPRTIEVHRARIMEKLGARNAADLVRIVLTSGA
ncbi:response regulator transcription factor [Methylobrevis pamukkalensis]|uniref:Transcriptional regulatory protein TdiR n=1 Tax=Methylobrevis pamukkalensis TaxID=1439726 RepID=A0A1E3H7P6_9HYPH|nr:response regulator [Methylobrevis pamukkalensis]ODN72343.1 Transcriptional regulatory protein TdiR [Methylobrevis pamukkalensis]